VGKLGARVSVRVGRVTVRHSGRSAFRPVPAEGSSYLSVSTYKWSGYLSVIADLRIYMRYDSLYVSGTAAVRLVSHSAQYYPYSSHKLG